MMEPTGLSDFHPFLRQWFLEAAGQPTEIQRKAWPAIKEGRHVLLTAPTGSGKTLSAFLWLLNQLISGSWPRGRLQVLYVSPLKALNNDIQKNLLSPLAAIDRLFLAAGSSEPKIRVATRSGDTPPEERRQMIRRPPEILVTTPESLNILLTSKNGRRLLTDLKAVVLDEIHAVAGSKRGTHLMMAVERLVLLSGEFQRIALSATVQPPEAVAAFVGGYSYNRDVRHPAYRPRAVSIINAGQTRQYAVKVDFPEIDHRARQASVWPDLINAFKGIINRRRSTLLFTNSRRLTEKTARLLNEDELERLAYPHHGSLSKEIRLAVERKLKKGALKAIVATSSLELGIDIGELDQVILVQTPQSVSSAIQRIGRSGHRINDISRGVIFPTHGRDFLNAAVMAASIKDQAIEKIRPVESPLDVLAQAILSITSGEKWDLDALFAFIRTCHAFRNLSRRQFDLVVEMLAGRYADTRIKELKPRVYVDKLERWIMAKDHVPLMLYMSGGTIPDRGYYDLRIQESMAKIGELDEEFVWERRVGETFSLGNQSWRIQQITHSDILVTRVSGQPGTIPFWKAEPRNRDFAFAESIGRFLEMANAYLKNDFQNNEADGYEKEASRDERYRDHLIRNHMMAPQAAQALIDYLRRQKEVTRLDLPHRYHLVFEHFDDPLNKHDGKQVVLHTLWGGRINRPLAMAIAAAWEDTYAYSLETFADDDCILFILPHRFEPSQIFNLVSPAKLEILLRGYLEKSGYFGALFRENAGRALLLPRATFKKRMPLWLNRLRSKKLFEAVKRLSDFPILLETWRTALQDEFDLGQLKILLDEVAHGRIQVSECYTKEASPFAESIIWRQTNQHMYEDDTPKDGRSSGLSPDLLSEIIASGNLRPRFSKRLIALFEKKVQRLAPGYAPKSTDDLLEWLNERLLVPIDEWRALLKAVQRDHQADGPSLLKTLSLKIVRIKVANAAQQSVCTLETVPYLLKTLVMRREALDIKPIVKLDLEDQQRLYQNLSRLTENNCAILPSDAEAPLLHQFVAQWLAYYGPVDPSVFASVLGLQDAVIRSLVHDLLEADAIVSDQFYKEEGNLRICERRNYEILLRLSRSERRPRFEALALEALPLFIAAFQGLAEKGDGVEDLQGCLEQLFGFISHAQAWEEYIFPARLNPYYTTWLDTLLQTSELIWYGGGPQRIGFSFGHELPIYLPLDDHSAQTTNRTLLPETYGRYSLFDIVKYNGLTSYEASERLWQSAWRGEITNDHFSTVRQGVLTRFKPDSLTNRQERGGRGRPGRRSRFNRWKATRPIAGNWLRLNREQAEVDIVDEEELKRDRIRQLLKRYGLVFRELVAHETGIFAWNRLFRSLRLMELSGEILGGHFFEGIYGLQFISHEAFRQLREGLPEEAIYWMNATDPASLCGIDLKDLKAEWPARRVSSYIVCHGRRLVLSAKQSFKQIDFRVAADHPHLSQYSQIFKDLMGREFNPLRAIRIDIINDLPAATCPYADALTAFGFRRAGNSLELRPFL